MTRTAKNNGSVKFPTILADPPWQFQNRTGKVAPEHKRLSRYGTLDLEQIKAMYDEVTKAHHLSSEDQDLVDHLDVQSSFKLDLGGEG